jgi:hypothetical protein
MNGYGDQYGVSYRTLHKVFELLDFRRSVSEKKQDDIRLLKKAALPSKSTEEIVGNQNEVEEVNDHLKNSTSDIDSDIGNEEKVDSPHFQFSISVAMLEIYNEMVCYFFVRP